MKTVPKPTPPINTDLKLFFFKDEKMEKHTSSNVAVKATASSKGQLVIPKGLRKSLGIHAGMEFF